MAKSYGKVGFSKTYETSPGVWEEVIIEKSYAFDVLQNHRRWSNDGNLNDDIVLTVKVSIVADDFATQNLPFVRYVEWHGNKYKVNLVDSVYPRYILNLGGIYNGESAPIAVST